MFDEMWHDLWIAIFTILIFVGIFTAEGLVIGLGVMGLLVAGTAWVWNRVSLEEVTYQRELPYNRVFIGDEIPMSIVIVNKKPVPLSRLSVDDEIPDSLVISDANIVVSANPQSTTLRHSTSMSWYERMRWEYVIKCTQRGFYRLGPAKISSGDLFGFFTSEKTVVDQDYVLVYPNVLTLPEMGIPSMRPLGESSGGIRIFEDPSRSSGIRDYQQGDPLKIVDWKATAKAQHLQVRTFEPSSSMTVIMLVVIETTARYWEGYSPINLERIITAAASFASYATEKQYTLGLFSNGTPILADRPMKVPPTRSPEQLTAILEALATIRPLAMGSMAAQLSENSRRFPIGSTLVVVAAFVMPELVEELDDLKKHGHRLVMVYVGDEECPVLPEGIIVHNLQDFFERMELASEFGPRQDRIRSHAAD